MANAPTTEFLANHLTDELKKYIEAAPSLKLRARVLRLIDLQNGFRKLGKSVVREAGWGTGGARDLIRRYLTEHKGQVIEGAELAVISGISEYGRRIRELREEGLKIITGPEIDPRTRQPLRPDQYLLVKG
jgi:hypothetical protein